MEMHALLSGLEILACGGPTDVAVQEIIYDSRQAVPGSLFVAIKGLSTDGHLYIRDAAARGAVAVVMEREAETPSGMAWVRVPDSRRALSHLAAAFYGHPARRLKLVGVTGTNGKTTTTHLLAAMYRAAGQRVGLIGTVENRIGERVLPVTHTTPESLDLQRLLAEMLEAGVTTVVMEVSSHALKLHRVADCEFDRAVFTNLTQDHLDFHGTLEDYLEAKESLFRGLAGGVKAGPKYAIINGDDARAGRIVAASTGINVTYGFASEADVRAEAVELGPRGSSFVVEGLGARFPLRLRLPGRFNVANALAACTVGLVEGLPVEVITEGLESVRGVPGRFEPVDCGQDFTVVVDYAHTPDGLEQVLRAARPLTAGRLMVVFGCGGDRDRTKRPRMGEVAARLADFTVLTSDNPRSEEPLSIIEEIEAGYRVVRRHGYVVEPDRRAAIRRALEEARSGDMVVIAGKGHETYQIVGQTRIPFDDREVAAATLKELLGGCRAEHENR